jgi:aspartyl-tRNA(Asn)/glutamyl-tRNA(Gln) amidotransferase subunit B
LAFYKLQKMITEEQRAKYEITIGLEIHVQLDTKTKMFCRCNNNSEGVEPNTNVCPICMGYPGTLPVMNEQAIEFGAKLAKALGCEINKFQRFDRKNYFYPDLPKGYQVSQFFFPMGEHGKTTIDYIASDRKTKKEFTVGITRLHLEEDAGKLTHVPGGSLVDLNRCGTPLAEIVTGPDFESPEQAKAFMQELQRIVRALGVSSADMEKGHMRVDGNISVRLAGAKELGNKVEIKNMNSFRFLEAALKFEAERQMAAVEAGETIVQETRGWDEKTSSTVSQRLKEGSVDYRYFPEPDLPPLQLSDEWLDKVISDEDTLPRNLRVAAESFGLSYDRVNELQDKLKLQEFVGLLKGNSGNSIDVVKLANILAKGGTFADGKSAADFFEVVAANNLSSTASDKLFEMMQTYGENPADLVNKLESVDDDGLRKIVAEVLAANPAEAERYKAGEAKLIGVFVGQVMAKSGGVADASTVRVMIDELLTK